MPVVNGVTLHDIDSSLLAAVGYDAVNHQLYCQFHPSARQAAAVWRYDGVNPAEWARMSSASSMGKYFLQNIKGAKTSNRVS